MYIYIWISFCQPPHPKKNRTIILIWFRFCFIWKLFRIGKYLLIGNLNFFFFCLFVLICIVEFSNHRKMLQTNYLMVFGSVNDSNSSLWIRLYVVCDVNKNISSIIFQRLAEVWFAGKKSNIKIEIESKLFGKIRIFESVLG